MDLYDQIAEEYDQITGEADRAAPAEAFLTELRRRHPFDTALDAACGTGLHAVMLARMGVQVTGADISRAMLDSARQRAAQAGVDVRWVHAPMQQLGDQAAGPFGAVLCLGNSLPHLLADGELDGALAGFVKRLAPGGTVVLQMLNYSRILAAGERIVGITRKDDSEYVRFYDFLDGLVRFNVLTIRWQQGRCESHLASTMLRPHRPADLAESLRRAGCSDVALYAGFQFTAFDESRSDTLLILATKP